MDNNTELQKPKDSDYPYVPEGETVEEKREARSGTSATKTARTTGMRFEPYPKSALPSTKPLPKLHGIEEDMGEGRSVGVATTAFGMLTSGNNSSGLLALKHDNDIEDMDLPESGPPPDSTSKEDYESYKDLDAKAEAAYKRYMKYLGPARGVTEKMGLANPGKYKGKPWATKEWHGKAATLAGHGHRLCERAAQPREKVARDFVGYDTHIGAKGHRNRVEKLWNWGAKLETKYTLHSNSHELTP